MKLITTILFLCSFNSWAIYNCKLNILGQNICLGDDVLIKSVTRNEQNKKITKYEAGKVLILSEEDEVRVKNFETSEKEFMSVDVLISEEDTNPSKTLELGEKIKLTEQCAQENSLNVKNSYRIMNLYAIEKAQIKTGMFSSTLIDTSCIIKL
jgi:hypothetical protein